MKSEAALDVVEKAEVLAGLLNGDNVHEASGVGGVGANLAVDLDEALLDDGVDLPLGEGVLQPVPEEDDEGQALAGLVGTGRWLGSPDSGELVQHPVAGGIETLKVLLGSANLTQIEYIFNNSIKKKNSFFRSLQNGILLTAKCGRGGGKREAALPWLLIV